MENKSIFRKKKLFTKKKIRGITKSNLNSNLKIAVKGAGIIIIGQIIGTIIGLISLMILARSYSVGEYGLYGLGIFIVSFFLSKSTLGVLEGTPRFISYYRGCNDDTKIKSTIKSSLFITILTSTLFAFVIFFLSDFIAFEIFGIEELSDVIKTIVISIPFWAIIRLIIGIFRGFESTKENVYFSNISLGLLKIPFFSVVVIIGLSFNYIIVAHVLSVFVTFLIAIIYFKKRSPFSFGEIKKVPFELKSLLGFSLPLIFSGMGWFFISGADKLMLGIMATEIEVGLYNSAVPLAQYLKFFLSTIIFVYMPIASRLLAENKVAELKRNYQILTKWLCLISFPIITILLFVPEKVIFIIFGSKYLSASFALRLLTIAYFTHLLFGPNGTTITSIGKTKIVMYFTLAGGLINIILNSFFIPLYSINGAAFSTMVSLILINLLNGLYLYKISKIHPFNKNYVIPIFSSLLILFLLYYLSLQIENGHSSYIFRIFSIVLLILFYYAVMLVSRSYDKEDIELLVLFEEKIGINLKIIRNILRRFI